MAPKSKLQLEDEIAQLEKDNLAKAKLLEEASELISQYEDQIALGADTPALDATTAPTKDAPSSERSLREPELLSDPYSRHNPHQPVSHPAGKRLSWKNAKYRASRGWEGWVKVEWDDDIGKNLHRYLNEVPDRMDGAVDNYVRRGDVILCWLPEVYYLSRQKARQEIIDRYDSGDPNKRRDDPRKKHLVDEDDSNGRRLGGKALLS